MAFPVVQGRQTGSTTSNATTHTITFPASIAVGELLLVFVSEDGSSLTVDNEGAWTKIGGQQKNGTTVTGAVFAKIAEGGAADNLTVVTVSEQISWVSFRISGHGGIPTGAWANGSSTNSDPPNHTPPYGAQDYLWIAGRMGDADVAATAAPTNYSNLTGVAHSSAANGASVHTAERSLNASSENPGTFTSATEQWAAVTVAVPPANMTFPRLKQVYYVQNTTSGSTSLATSSFTPADNELIVVKAATNDSSVVIGTPTGGSLTYTRRSSTTSGSFCYTVLDTAQVGTSPGSMAVTVPYSGSAGVRAIVVERWENAQLDATPVVNATKTGSGGPTASLTTEAANSVVTWVNSDWNNVDPAAYVYRDDCVEDGIARVRTSSPSFAWYAAYQYVPSIGSETFGISSPVGQAYSIHGIEIQYRATAATTATAENASATGTANNAAPKLATSSTGDAAGTGTSNQAAAKLATASTGNAGATGTGNNAVPVLGTGTGNAAGTGTANQPALVISDTQPAELADSTGSANAATAGVTAAAGNASATGTANGPLPATTPITASGTGSANQSAAAITVAAGNASATGTANAAAPAVVVSGGNAAGTGTANTPAPMLTAPAGNAAGTGTANGPGTARTPVTADGTGTANTPALALTVPAGNAAGTGTANDAAPTTANRTNVSAQNAAGTGSANPPAAIVVVTNADTPPTGAATTAAATASVAPAAGNAAATGTSNAPAAAITPAAGNAAAAGTAGDAAVGTAAAATAAAELAAGTGTSNAAAAGVGPASGVAAGSGGGFMPDPQTVTNAGNAAGTAAANNAAVSAVAATTAAAGVAAGTGSANNAGTNVFEGVTALPEVAGGDGAALDPTIVVRSSGARGWNSLLETLHAGDDPDPRSGLACPRCGEPYRTDRGGARVCAFDGYAPDGRTPARSSALDPWLEALFNA